MYYSKEDILQAEHNALLKAVEDGNDYPMFAGRVIGIMAITEELLRKDREANG